MSELQGFPSIQAEGLGGQLQYAGFGRRFTAWLIDALALFTLGLLLRPAISFIWDLIWPNVFSVWFFQLFVKGMLGKLLICDFVLNGLYYVGYESSKYQGTFGKQICELKVTDKDGDRITFLQASGRYGARALASWVIAIGLSFQFFGWIGKTSSPFTSPSFVLYFGLLIFLIGLMVGFVIDNMFILLTSRKQALHDLLAQTEVISYGVKGVKRSKHQIVGLSQLSQDP